MPKICIKHPFAGIGLLLLLLSACNTTPIRPAVEISAQVQQAYKEALASMKAGKDKQAIKQFRKISKDNPTLSGPYTNLGILYFKANSLQQAEKSLLKATELNAENKLAYNYLGIVYRSQGHFEEAEKVYLKALALDPNYSYAHLNLGILYDLYKSDYEKALNHYQTYLSLADKPDKMVEKWIVDLKRRDTSTAQTKAEDTRG